MMATISIIFLRINRPNLNCVPQLPYFALPHPEDFCDAFFVARGAVGRPCLQVLCERAE